ncbi:hypothetical protein GCM10009847_15520 [Leucobacter tardus]|nr:hypothetical protein [Leucobacter tardus]
MTTRTRMRDNFLRGPSSAGDWVADGLRAVGVLGVIGAAIWGSLTDAGILAFVLPALMLPRFVGARSGFDIAFSITVLIAAWSNVWDLYRSFLGWDTIVHLVCTGVLAPMAYLLLARLRIVPAPAESTFLRRTAITHSALIGFAVSALWELVEWVGFEYVTEDIYTTYDDTIGDMAAGGLGALIVGIAFAWRPFAFERYRSTD